MLAAFLLSLFVFLVRGFDVIHAANPPDTFVLIALPYKLMGRRFVFDHHDLAPEQYQARFRGHSNRLAYFTLVSLEKLSCRVADRVITTNESYKAMEMRRGGVPAERITVVRNGPVLGEYHLAEPDPGLRQKGKTIIGYVGVIGVQDGVDYLLRALGHLVVDLGRQDVFCVIIGRGEALEGLRVLASELGLEELVWFAGWMWPSDFIPYLSAADICVVPDPSNPYNDRSTMIKVMEYMALGKPIVAFDLPENRFSAQDAALYVRPNNELEFAKALAELMDDPERRRTMGEFGYRRVRDHLAWEYSAANLLRAYGSLWAGLDDAERLDA